MPAKSVDARDLLLAGPDVAYLGKYVHATDVTLPQPIATLGSAVLIKAHISTLPHRKQDSIYPPRYPNHMHGFSFATSSHNTSARTMISVTKLTKKTLLITISPTDIVEIGRMTLPSVIPANSIDTRLDTCRHPRILSAQDDSSNDNTIEYN
ncbi:hypothetical protein SERLA73DRAFT_79041 [Serpula lacrymans var. lacrymans S7.3]|uniref:Uncharacterized protein n=1 Tax=Serpula lacrymans var. lacrymans (strain S7.3) TaxID=936435 RepID=F8QF39_SERL3|nr:hypothetical protein SERLA73DRAFT_79041 [Serpula lacrymans var. lacrymans S7.3]